MHRNLHLFLCWESGVDLIQDGTEGNELDPRLDVVKTYKYKCTVGQAKKSNA